MKKYILFIMLVFVSNMYAFSLNELTAKFDVDRANRLMKKGDYEGAVSLYEKALSKVPNSPEIFYNMGTTMSSIGELNSALQLFDMAKKSATEKTSKEMKSSIHYNAGLTRIEGKDYQGAIDELVESLVNTPNDENSKRALEYAYKKLEEQKNQQNNTGPSSQNQDNNQNQSGQSDNNGGSSGQNDNNQNNNQGDQNDDNNQNDNNQDENNNDQDNQNNQNNNDNQDDQNNQNNNDNNSNNNDDQNNNGSQNEDNQDSKSDIDRLLESLRQLRKDKDNGDQYYGGGRIDKDW